MPTRARLPRRSCAGLASAVVLGVAACSPSPQNNVSTRPAPATAVVSASYENGSLPPPYHYAYDLLAHQGQVTVRWRAGYEQREGPTWVETARYKTAQLRAVLTRLDSTGCLDLQVSKGKAPPGAPYVTEFTVRDGTQVWSAAGPAPQEDIRRIQDCIDIIEKLAPAQIWERLTNRQQRWAQSL